MFSKRFFSWLLIFTGPFCVSQAPNSSKNPGDLTATGIAPSDVVIRMDNFCDQQLLLVGTVTGSKTAPEGDKQKGGCAVEVTRAQFEQMVDTVASTMSNSNRIRIAVQYPEHLAFASKARELHLEQDPQFLAKLKLNYLQLLARTYTNYLAQQAGQISDQEVEKFYKEHPETFAQVELLRIYVPKGRQHESTPSTPSAVDAQRKQDEAAMKDLAEQLRKRALAGEDFEKLQLEADKAAGDDPDDPTDVHLGLTTRDEIPKEYREVFDLKIGEISGVIAAGDGWYISKILSRTTIPVEKARTVLVRIRLRDATNAARESVHTTFNDNYFNTPHGMEPAKESTLAK
jgi:bifunctional DNA-binding transcriptional regulator/antitoxin component of YhaV-PrlF toxin-antitoxin module